MTKRRSLATWLLCATLLSFGCDDDKSKGGDAMDDAGPGGDGDVGDGDSPGDGDNPGDGGNPGDGDGSDAGGDGDVPVDTGTVTGFVFDTQTPPLGLKGVTVQGPGGKSTVTLDDGSFTLEDVPVGKDAVIITSDPAHTRALRNVGVLKGRTSYVDLVVKNVITASFDPAKGGSVKGSDGAGATFQAGSLTTKDGGEPSGQVTVTVAAIDPTKSQESKAFPGKSEGKNAADKSGLVVGYAPMEVSVKDDAGKQVQIKEGKNAEFDFPVSDNLTDAPDEIDLWSLLEDTGIWKLEGKAVKKRDDAGHIIYKAIIGHLSWWSCNAFVENVTCVHACVTDEKGDKASAAQVVLTSVGAPFRVVEATDADGCFAANLPLDSDIIVQVASATGVSNATAFHTGTTTMNRDDDLAACQALDPIELVARPAQGACATGYTECTNGDGPTQCVDLASDSNRCGTSCDTAIYCGSGSQVPGSGPYYSVCVNGTCQCPPGWTDCDGQCVNTKNDPYHCGSCTPEKSCDYASEVCNNGTCETLVCDDGEDVCSGRNGPVCANTQSSRYNCGGCNQRCGVGGELSDVLYPGYVCEAGVCGCEDGLTRCQPYKESPTDVQCVDTKTDNTNCGGCYQDQDVINELAACDYNSQECTNGVCTDIVCPDGQSACNRECVDLQTDENNCAECGLPCGEGKTCEGGSCVCPAGTTECQGRCIDPMKDNDYCGGCPDGGAGIVCAGDQTCVGGQCAQVMCLENQAACGNHQCADLQTDENNCGGCGYYCQATDTSYPSTCVAGLCTCPAGQELCGLQGSQFCQPTGMCPPILTEPTQ